MFTCVLFQKHTPVKNSGISPHVMKKTNFYKKQYAGAYLCRAPPKSLDKMWHSPVFTSRFAIRIHMMIIMRSYMKTS